MKEKLIQSTAGALNCWRKCEECRVISNTGNNDQTGVASYGQKTPSWPAQYTVCNVQCMHKGPKLGTWSSWGPNCWNGPHLVLIHTRGLIFSIMREKWQWSCEKGRYRNVHQHLVEHACIFREFITILPKWTNALLSQKNLSTCFFSDFLAFGFVRSLFSCPGSSIPDLVYL